MANYFPIGKVGAKTIYADKALCELAEGQECFEITGLDAEILKVENGQVVEDADKKAAKDAAKAQDDALAIDKAVLLAELKDRGSKEIKDLIFILGL